MRKFGLLAVLGIVVLASLSIAAQNVPQKASRAQPAKVIRISGKVSEDGTMFVQESNLKVWHVTNPETLKGYEGELAMIRGKLGTEANTVQLLSIERQASYTANWGDSAFRR